MSLQQTLSHQVKQAVFATYNIEIDTIEFQATRKEFAGDITVVIFPMLRFIKGNPVQIGTLIGDYLVENVENVKAFNVVKGFLNIEIDDSFLHELYIRVGVKLGKKWLIDFTPSYRFQNTDTSESEHKFQHLSFRFGLTYKFDVEEN